MREVYETNVFGVSIVTNAMLLNFDDREGSGTARSTGSFMIMERGIPARGL
jgi:hypothetical protein